MKRDLGRFAGALIAVVLFFGSTDAGVEVAIRLVDDGVLGRAELRPQHAPLVQVLGDVHGGVGNRDAGRLRAVLHALVDR